MYYERLGTPHPTLPAVVMLHGLGGDHRGLRPIAEKLETCVYLLDLSGFGESEELEHHDLHAYATEIVAFCRVQGIERPILFGHSLGSAIALSVANEMELSGLVLLNPVVRLKRGVQMTMDLVHAASGVLPEKSAHTLLHSKLFDLGTFVLHQRKPSKKYLKEYVALQQSTPFSVRAWREASRATKYADQFAMAADVLCPTIVIHGEKDSMISLTTAKKFTQCLQNGRLEVLAGTGHFSHSEKPSEIATLVTDFVTEQFPL